MNVQTTHAPEDAAIAHAHQQATAEQKFNIVLKPLSHAELSDIRIVEDLFAIGRTEVPFMSYAPEVVADLSRRHARIFSEYGAVYIADLDSKNGTTVNGVDIRQKIIRLQQGDEICFGRALSYQVHLSACVQMPGRAGKLVSLTLSPERGELGLQPIVVTQFPFLISKADETFARYKDAHPHQVNYISRRHAHIFLKGGIPFVEDLGSTNGTFVAGKRLDEHAVALTDGDSIAFGGHYFVYKVSLQRDEPGIDPTVTKFSPAATQNPVDMDKTTFVGAAGSFLDIFCVDHAQQLDDEVNHEALQQADDARKETEQRQPRGKFRIFISELTEVLADKERKGIRHAFWWGTGLAAVLAMVALLLYLSGASERDLKNLMASGDYGQAATVANGYLERHPDNAEVKALGTEALLKAGVPQWVTMVRAREFDRASAALANMKELGARNADVQALLSELEWIGNLEKFAIGQGGMDAPIRIYADEQKINAILQRWNEDTMGHQRMLARILSYVPEFRDTYAGALSHLRRLQSDDSVYLAAIERLKTAISTELNQDRPEALDAILSEYAEKYPRIGGLENVRQDLRQYIEIDNNLRAENLSQLIVLLAHARFSSPPFQAKFRALRSGNRLPPAEVVGQYQAVSKAWQAGDTKQAFAGLQKMAAGPWAELASRQLEHKTAIAEQFAALQKARGANGYDERLLSFYAALDPDEDAYFIQATEADIGLHKDKALKRAQDLLSRAQTLWQQYRENGAITEGQRLEDQISPQYRTQARLLSDAYGNVQQGTRIYTQLKADTPAEWRKVQDEIKAEAEQQRRSLLELRTVLAPGLLKEKLALLSSRSKNYLGK